MEVLAGQFGLEPEAWDHRVREAVAGDQVTRTGTGQKTVFESLIRRTLHIFMTVESKQK